jgi:2-oxo-4-hydroxy-4-carboxy-5-ureidoimidazoline decarboxylase
MTLDALNACSRERFVDAIGWVFEHSPWVAEQAWEHRPFLSIERLHATMTAAVAGADRDRQLALLRAHPDLGTRARMSEASTGEQRGAGLDSLTREELDRLRRANQAYRGKFGFPFLYAVKGSTKHDVILALERRLAAAPDDEFEEALRQVSRIAEFRLRDVLGSG